MRRWNLLLFVPLLCGGAIFAGCGDDNPDTPGTDSGLTDGPGTTDGPGPTDGGGDSNNKDAADGSVDTSSFPKYVKSLIETKTNATGVPDTAAVWGAIPDDDKFVFLPTFFP